MIHFNEFGTSTPAGTDYIVGYNNTNSGGEKRWTIQQLIDYMKTQLASSYVEFKWITTPNASPQILATANTWYQLTLNTMYNPNNLSVSLNADTFSLPAGTYAYEGRMAGRWSTDSPPAAQAILQLWSSSLGNIQSANADNTDYSENCLVCHINGQVVLTSNTSMALRAICTRNSFAIDSGAGVNGSALFTNADSNMDQRTTIKFWKLS